MIQQSIEVVDLQGMCAYDLLLRAQSLWEQLQTQQAEQCFRLSLGKEITQEGLISYCQFLKGQNRIKQIEAAIDKCLPIEQPFHLYKKYFIKAEQQQSIHALAWYKQGLECGQQLLLQDDSFFQKYSLFKHDNHKLNRSDLLKDLSSACAAAAQICMNDLQHVAEIKEVCQMAIAKGRQFYEGIDILVQQSRFLLLTGWQEQARASILKAVSVLGKGEQADDDLKLQMARVLNEFQEWRASLKILESVEEGERDQETLYLLAFINFKLQQYDQALDWLSELQAYAKANQCDPEIKEAWDELEREIGKLDIGEEGNPLDDQWEDAE